MTKPVTSVAIMMLHEQGQLDLDDPVSDFLPGFDQLQVLTSTEPGQLATAPVTTPMTVRHLLSHTSGIGYAFASATVAAMQQATPAPEWELPLLNEPGAVWHYSASTRVLGMIVEAISGQSLEAFFQDNILEPLAMHDTSFAVAAEKQTRLTAVHTRGPDGALQASPQGNAPSTPTPPFAGDGGLYSTAHDYGQFMRMLLNGGTLDGVHVLDEANVALMGENQIGDSFVEEQVSTNPGLSRNFPLGAGRDKFGLGFQITSAESAVAGQRAPGSLAWAGIFNTEFWIDPQQGIAATLLMQVLPFYDEGALRALSDFETAVYGQLVSGGAN
jgi:CubicO group peptidase (beta-lactamase class C family)